MTKYFILNIVLNLAIALLVYSGIMSFQGGNQLIVFASIALLVVLIYLKVVLLKVVKKNVRKEQETPKQKQRPPKRKR